MKYNNASYEEKNTNLIWACFVLCNDNFEHVLSCKIRKPVGAR